MEGATCSCGHTAALHPEPDTCRGTGADLEDDCLARLTGADEPCSCTDYSPDPTCDFCGRTIDDSPAGFADADWNGETGNHETCENVAAIARGRQILMGMASGLRGRSS